MSKIFFFFPPVSAAGFLSCAAAATCDLSAARCSADSVKRIFEKIFRQNKQLWAAAKHEKKKQATSIKSTFNNNLPAKPEKKIKTKKNIWNSRMHRRSWKEGFISHYKWETVLQLYERHLKTLRVVVVRRRVLCLQAGGKGEAVSFLWLSL